jgi:Spy/CpxP family protein refolding chaperone
MRPNFLKPALWIALLLIATPILAQHGHGPNHDGVRGHDPSMHERLMARLELTETQRERVEQLTTEHRDMMQDLVATEKETRQAMMDQTHAAEFDESAIRAAVMIAAIAQADVAVERSRLHQQIREELTETQRARLDQMIQRRRSFMQHGKGRHDGERFRPMEPRPEHQDLDQD